MPDINVTITPNVQTTVVIPTAANEVIVSTQSQDLSNYVTKSETGNFGGGAGSGILQSDADSRYVRSNYPFTGNNNLVLSNAGTYVLDFKDQSNFIIRSYDSGSIIDVFGNDAAFNEEPYIKNFRFSGQAVEAFQFMRFKGQDVVTGSIVRPPDLDNASGVLSNRLSLTGAAIISLIGVSNAGVSTLNNLSGAILLTGSGNITISRNGQTLIVSGDTGVYANFYQNSNPQGFSTSGNLATSGANLQSQISLLNAWSGQITGYVLSSQSGQFYPKSNPFNFATTGDLQSSGANLQSQISNLNIWSGQSTGAYYPLRSNPSGYITNSQTGQFYPLSNPYNFANSGDLSTSGSNFQSQLGKINSWTGSSTGDYYPRGINPSGFTTTSALNAESGVLDNRLFLTGSGLLALITSSSAGVASLNGTSGIVNLAGQGNVSVAVNGQTINISGNTGAYTNFYNVSNPFNFATSGNLEFTGIALQGQVNTLNTWTGQSTGAYYPLRSNPSGYITNSQTGNFSTVQITGGTFITPNFTGVGKISIAASGNIVYISGVNLIDSSQTGQFYPTSNPQAFANTGNLGAYYLNTNPSNFATSGNLAVTGVDLYNQISTIRNGNYVTGISITGASFTGLLNITGAGGIFYKISGSLVTISGELTKAITDSLYYAISNPQGFANSGNLSVSGSNFQSQLGNLSIWTGQSTGSYYPLGTNPSGYATVTALNNSSGVIDSRLSNTGTALINLINSLNVTTVNTISGSISLTGTGIISLTRVGQVITISGDTGSYANFYQNSNPQSFANSGNLSTSGSNFQSQISSLNTWSGQSTGAYYPLRSNPSGYLISTNLDNASGVLDTKISTTGSNLFNLVNHSYVTGLSVTGAALTGLINLTGAGGFSFKVSGNNVIFSGDLTKAITDSLYYGISNPNNFATSGNLDSASGVLNSKIGASSAGVSSINNLTGATFITGTGIISLTVVGQTIFVSGNTGTYSNFYQISNPFNFANSGDLSTSGSNFQSQISTLNIWTGQSTGAYYPLRTNPSGYIIAATLDSASGVLNTKIGASSAGVSSINTLTGALLITGTGIITISAVGQTIFVSGNTGTYANFYQVSNPFNFANSGDLSTSGSNFQSQISLLNIWSGQSTGAYYPLRTNPSGYITASQVPSGNSLPIIISSSGLISGSDSTFIKFPQYFTQNPIVFGSISNISGESTFAFHLSGISTSGFFVNTSDLVASNNYQFSYIATTGSGFLNLGGLANPASVVVTETGISRVLGIVDVQAWIRTTYTGGVTITVPAQTGVSWPNYTEITLEQAGSGQITVATGIGVTINSSSTLKTYGQYAVVGLKRVNTDLWTLVGERA